MTTLTIQPFLEANGIHNARDVIIAAHKPGRPTLPRCLALLDNETSGGLNIYGHEGPCPQLWGRPVTQANYQIYKAAREHGEGNNGVGPCQLTATSYQVEAERLGGCWAPLFNMSVGFHLLHELILEHGVAGGFEHYNGSGPAAEAYAERALDHAVQWQRLLAEHDFS